MSLILEALKKSERERRLGETPSIGSPVIAVRRQRSRLPLLIGLIAAALVIGWWLRREAPATATPETTAASTAAVPAAAPAVNPAPPPVRAAEPPERAQSNADARMPRSKAALDATAAMAPDLRAKVKNGEIVVANPNLLIPGRSSTIASPDNMPSPPPAIAPIDAPPGAERQVMRMANPQTLSDREKLAETKQPSSPAVAAPTAAKDPAAPAEAAPVARPSGSLMLLWELPYAKRREIPELKVTMHVFASEPAQRFIIVNGDRHVEGDDLEGLKVIEIRADGVVLEFDGQRFLYPRGGR